MIYRLSECNKGKLYKIVAVNSTEKQTAKLDKLGIFPGETVEITKKIGKSALLIGAGGAVIAVGREIAEQIEVAETNAEDERSKISGAKYERQQQQ